MTGASESLRAQCPARRSFANSSQNAEKEYLGGGVGPGYVAVWGQAVLDKITSVDFIPVLAFNRPFPMETTKFGSTGPKHLHREVQSRNVGVIGDNSGK